MSSSCGRDKWVATSGDYGGILVIETVVPPNENLGFMYRFFQDKNSSGVGAIAAFMLRARPNYIGLLKA